MCKINYLFFEFARIIEKRILALKKKIQLFYNYSFLNQKIIKILSAKMILQKPNLKEIALFLVLLFCSLTEKSLSNNINNNTLNEL